MVFLLLAFLLPLWRQWRRQSHTAATRAPACGCSAPEHRDRRQSGRAAEPAFPALVIGEVDAAAPPPQPTLCSSPGSPLASYRGGLADLCSTSPSVTGAALDASSVVQAYLGYLTAQQQSALAAIESALGARLERHFTYQVAFNGFALVLTPAEAASVVRLGMVQRCTARLR